MSLTSMCIYRVIPGKEQEFMGLLERHWPTMRRLGLAADEPPVVYRGKEKENSEPIIVEFFTWKDASGPENAHKLPEVASIWEPMGALCETREGRPAMEFPSVEPIKVHYSS